MYLSDYIDINLYSSITRRQSETKNVEANDLKGHIVTGADLVQQKTFTW